MTLDNQEMTVVNQKCPIFIRKWLQMTRINLSWPLKTLVDQKQIVTRKLPKFNRFNQHCNALACLKRDLEMWQKVSGPCCNISSLWEDIFFYCSICMAFNVFNACSVQKFRSDYFNNSCKRHHTHRDSLLSD